MSKNRLALPAVIALWSLSPIFVQNFGKAFDPERAAALTVCVSFALVATGLYIWGHEHLAQALDSIRNASRDLWILAGVGLLAYVIYPICYFTGLRSNQAVAANIVNYTWPLVFVMCQAWLRGKRVSFVIWMGMACAFVGALISTGDVTGFTDFLAGAVKQQHIDTKVVLDAITKTSGRPFFCALLGAAAYGGYSALAPTIRPKDPSGNPLSDPARFLVMLFVAACFHMVLQLYTLVGHESSMPPLNDVSWLFLVGYILLSFTAGHFLWLTVRSDEEAKKTTSPTAPYTYFIFVIGTILLSIQTGHGGASRDLLAGMALVLSGIYIVGAAPGIAPSSSFFIALTIAMASSTYVTHLPNVSASQSALDQAQVYLSLLQCHTGVFAILAGFTLQRLQVRTRESHRNFCGMIEQLRRLRDLIPQGVTGYASIGSCAAELCRYHVWRFQPNIFWETSKLAPPPGDDWKAASLELHQKHVGDVVDAIADSNAQKDAREILTMLRSKVFDWNAFDLDSISQYERVALRFLLLAAVLVLVTQLPILGPAFGLLRCLLLAAMFVVVVAIESYQRGGESTLHKALLTAEEICADSAQEIITELNAREKRNRSMDRWFIIFVSALVFCYVLRSPS